VKLPKTPILLTGASGFAGAHMLKYLIENSEAHVFCPVTYKHGGHKNRIRSIVPAIYSQRFTIFNCDLASDDLGKFDFMKSIETIINFASESHVDRSISDPKHFTMNNANLMINLLEYVRSANLKIKFIHVSTDEVFGPLEKLEDNFEWQRPHFPSNPYSSSKSAQESLLIAYHKTYNLDTTIINFTNMIGEAQNQEKFIPKTIKKILENSTINIDTNTNGQIGARRYIYVGDVAKAILAILSSQHEQCNDKLLPEKFHVFGTKLVSNLEIVLAISRILNLEFKHTVLPSPRNGYDTSYQLSSNNMKNIDWVESESIFDKLAQVVKWTTENPEWLEIDHTSLNKSY